MPDYRLEPDHLVVAGMTGSGKTTFVNRFLLNCPGVAVRTIFDDMKRMSERLRLNPCRDMAACNRAVPSRWVSYQPALSLAGFRPMPGIPSPAHEEFRRWCDWNWKLAQRGPGRKLVCLPEMWRFCTLDSIPPQFAALAQAGRELGISLVMDTSTPEKLNPALDGQITELVCFKLISSEALKAVRRMGADPEEVKALPMGHFVAYNRLSGGTLRGRVFDARR